MLYALKKWASGWVAFILISLLILSFAVWGIGDMVTNYGRGVVASIGDKDISEHDFQQAFQDELNAISQRAGQRITYDQARAVGLDNRVLSRLIGSTAVEVHAENLNLDLSDQALADGLKADPAFQGPDGSFSRARLDGVLYQMGLNETRLLELRRRDELREQVTSALMRSIVVPDALLQQIHQWREEKRVVSHFQIDADKVVKVDEPDETKLKAHYEENKAQFMTPPVRHLAVLTLPVAALKEKAPLTDEQIKEAYEQTKSTYDVPEKRRIEQIPFADRPAAQAALDALATGKSFVEVAKEAGASESDIALGLLEKSQMIDPAIAEAAFKLEKDKVSAVVEGKFTTVLLRVTEIQPGRLSTFEEVKDQVRDKLAQEWASSELQTAYNEVDDGRAAAKSLKEIGELAKLPYYDVPEVDRNNKTIAGGTALDIADGASIVAAGFAGEMGVEAEPIQMSDGGYAWIDVLGVSPAKERPFAEVKDAVKSAYMENERRKALSEAAAKFVERIKAGEDMSKVAADAGGTMTTSLPVTRTTIPQGLTQGAISQAFVLAPDGASSAETANGMSRTVFRVDRVDPAPALTKEARTQLKGELEQQLQADQIAGYLSGLQARLGVTINQPALRRLTGAEQGVPPGG